MDRTLYDFFYRYWFRAEVEGIENVPADGGALLVSNHSGALPPDAAMIAKAIREEHPHPRPLNITVEHFFKGYPGFSMLIPKIGCVPAHPANVHRLLFDERAARARVPRGPQGHREALQGPLPAAALRARRLRGGGDARPGPHRPGLRGRGGGGGAGVRAGGPAEATHRPPVFPDHPHLPAPRPARDARLPARQVPAPLPRADPLRGGGAARGQGARADARARGARARSRRTSGTCSPSASRCGSDE